jgi:hypothetical protein
MPTKTTGTNGKRYKIDGKTFTWTTEEGELVSIPMRVKMKVLRVLDQSETMDAAGMFAMLELLVPDQAETLDDMDVNDFTTMFSAWQKEYTALTGATPGE